MLKNMVQNVPYLEGGKLLLQTRPEPGMLYARIPVDLLRRLVSARSHLTAVISPSGGRPLLLSPQVLGFQGPFWG